MRTPRKVFADIREEAKQGADSLERSVNDTIENALWKKYATEHPLPADNRDYQSWQNERDSYVEQRFKPVIISAEDKEKIARNFRTESYLNRARGGIAAILISAPLIFSAGSCASCATDPDYNTFSHKQDELYALHWDIAEANDFILSAKRDSVDSIPYRATPEEVGVMKKRLENLTNYRDGVKNSSEYAKMEEAADSRRNKGHKHFWSGIAAAIGAGILSAYFGRVTERRTKRKNDKIKRKHLPMEAQ